MSKIVNLNRWARTRRREQRLHIFKVALLCLIMLAGASRCAFAACTQNGTASATSSQVVGTNDLNGIEGRHYFLIQNTGTTNSMQVAIGSNNNATSKDMNLSPGSSWIMTMQGLKMVPGGDVAVISAGGTTFAYCDW